MDGWTETRSEGNPGAGTLGGLIPVASIEHLIALKTGTGRHKDEIDIEELEKIKRSAS